MIRDRIKLVIDSNQNKSALALAGPPGVAARNIMGTNVHRAFKLPVERAKVDRFRQLQGEAVKTFQES